MGAPPPSQWPSKALGIAVTLFFTALALYEAAGLIEQVFPVLVVVGVVGVVVYVAWQVHQRRHGGW